MNIEIKDLSETRKSLVVTLDPVEVDAEHQAVVGEFSKHARLPGFRPGKAPLAMIVKRFSKDIEGEFKQKVLAKAYRGGIEQTKLDVMNIIGVEEGTLAPGTPATVTITIDLRPDFALPEYIGLPTEVSPTDPTEAEIDAAIDHLRAERADFKVAERASQKGDYVKLAYEGAVAGRPILEIVPDKQVYGKVPQTWEEVEGANEGLIPGLSTQLAGLKAGDKKEVTITFPAEFSAAPELSGQTATYTLDIQEIRERVLPPMDEAFFKANHVENVEGLRAKLTTSLKARKEYESRQSQRRQVAEVLTAKIDFAVPESLVENETQTVLRQFIEENMRRGIPAEQFEKDKKELYEGARKAAASRVKTQLLLAKIAEKEKITVTERDIDAFIYREAMSSGSRPDKLVKDLGKDRDRLRAVQQSIIFDKTLDLLVSKATVSTLAAQA